MSNAAARIGSGVRSPWALRTLALVRVAVGLYFGYEAVRKVGQGWLNGGSAFARSVNGYEAARSGGAYHHFVTDVILAHASVFAILVTLGEYSVAFSLTLGLLTRAGALIGLWLNLNFVLLRGLTNPGGTLDKVFIVAELAVLISAAGRVWGLDGCWRQELGQVPVVRWLAGAERPDRPQQASAPVGGG